MNIVKFDDEIYKEVLVSIGKIFNKLNIKYCIGFGMGLRLAGVNLFKPDDIDFVLDKAGAEHAAKVLEELADRVIRPFSYSKTDLFSNNLGTYIVNGIKVELISDLTIKRIHLLDFKNFLNPLIRPNYKKIRGVKIPYAKTKSIIQAYVLIERYSKVMVVNEFLEFYKKYKLLNNYRSDSGIHLKQNCTTLAYT